MRKVPIAVLLTFLIIGYSRCDDSDESLEEFFPARDCSKSECAENETASQSRVVANKSAYSSDHGSNFSVQGSNFVVSYSVNTNVDDSNGDLEKSVLMRVCWLCGHFKKSTPSTNRPSNQVTGNGRPHHGKKKTKNPTSNSETHHGSRWTVVDVTTKPPELTIGSNSNGPFTPTIEGDGQQVVNQAADGDSKSYLPSPPNCGISLTDRIIGGTQSLVGRWPWLVAYGFKDKRTSDDELLWMCGGSLVTEKHTITVAHCASIPTHYIYVARIGDIHLNSTLGENSIAEQTYVNKQIFTHPGYRKNQRRHDIAIVTLKKPFSLRYKPICLPFGQDMMNQKFVSKEAYVTGWGSTDYAGSSPPGLMEVKVPIVENSFCKKYYSSKNVSIEDHHMCAGGEEGKDACRGDSGGPLMMKNDNDGSFYLVGVVAFGVACGAPGVPGVYTRITSYMPWIEEILKA